jgi:hypothetical protein
MWILKIMAIGFFTGIGWYGAERLVIEPYLKPKEYVEAKNENQS